MTQWRPWLAALVLGLAAVGPAGAESPPGKQAPAAQQGDDADDTGRNVRDRREGTVTPLDQSNAQQDVDITQKIRQAIVGKDGLSTNAQNVKIVTRDGVVTLRGPVKSPEEKSTIVAEAWRAPGVRRVDDQLEVERNP